MALTPQERSTVAPNRTDFLGIMIAPDLTEIAL